MPLHIRTAQLPHHGRKGYFGRDALNITRGSGEGLGLSFAPSRELLNEGQRLRTAAKNKGEEAKQAAWDWYEPRYVEEMRAAWRRDRRPFLELLGREQVVLLCYCSTYSRCHRRLLTAILVKLGAIDCGEIGADPVVKPPEVTTWAEAEAKVPAPDLDCGPA